MFRKYNFIAPHERRGKIGTLIYMRSNILWLFSASMEVPSEKNKQARMQSNRKQEEGFIFVFRARSKARGYRVVKHLNV